MKSLTLTITPELAQMRLDRALSQLPEVRTRSRAARLLELGQVTTQGKPLKASHQTQQGEIIEVWIAPEPENQPLQPLALPLDIVYEDASLLVINKPAGLVVHPAAGHYQDTLVNALVHHTPDLAMGFHEKRPGIVHRLDRDTSGLLVVAKNDRAHEHLAHQFRQRLVHRVYWAVVFGSPKQNQGRIVSNLARHPRDRKRFASVRGEGRGKLAVTNYRVLQSTPYGMSLVELRLETGRTHQIRVHLSELGHPVVGDTLYGADKRIASLKSTALRNVVGELGRFALHAAELAFDHPLSSERLAFQAAPPADLNDLLASLNVLQTFIGVQS